LKVTPSGTFFSSAEANDFFSLLLWQPKASNSTGNSRLNLIFMERLVKGAGVKSFVLCFGGYKFTCQTLQEN